jgi:hypothetical protein
MNETRSVELRDASSESYEVSKMLPEVKFATSNDMFIPFDALHAA